MNSTYIDFVLKIYYPSVECTFSLREVMIEDAELLTSWSNLFYKNGAGLVFFLFQAEKPLALGQNNKVLY